MHALYSDNWVDNMLLTVLQKDSVVGGSKRATATVHSHTNSTVHTERAL
jgi:hypothetical protein